MSASLPSTYRLRIIALLGVLVAFDVIIVVAVYVLGHVALGLAPLVMYRFDALFWTMGFDLVPLEPVLIVGTPLVLVLQSMFGYRLTLREAREYDIGPDKQLQNIVLADGERAGHRRARRTAPAKCDPELAVGSGRRRGSQPRQSRTPGIAVRADGAPDPGSDFPRQHGLLPAPLLDPRVRR